MVLIDVRCALQYRASHIEGAYNIPWRASSFSGGSVSLSSGSGDASTPRDAAGSTLTVAEPPSELMENPELLKILGSVDLGALGKAFSEEKPTSPVGTCAIVYDSHGDTQTSVGVASEFAEMLAMCGLVPEIGRIGGGFQAFRELGDFVYTNDDEVVGRSQSSIGWGSGGGASSRQRRSVPLSRTYDGKLCTKTFDLPSPSVHGDGGRPVSLPTTRSTSCGQPSSGSSPNSTPRWKVSISAPVEVPPAEVIPGRLYLGNRTHAERWDTLSKINVTHVINVSRDGSTPFAGEVDYCVCRVADTVSTDLTDAIDVSYNYIQAAMRESEENVILVHCAGGVSRSSAIVAAYLMRSQMKSLRDVLLYIRQRHPAAVPNSGFIHQLVALEKRLGITGKEMDQADLVAATGYSNMNEGGTSCSSPSSTMSWDSRMRTISEGGDVSTAITVGQSEEDEAPLSSLRGENSSSLKDLSSFRHDVHEQPIRRQLSDPQSRPVIETDFRDHVRERNSSIASNELSWADYAVAPPTPVSSRARKSSAIAWGFVDADSSPSGNKSKQGGDAGARGRKASDGAAAASNTAGVSEVEWGTGGGPQVPLGPGRQRFKS